VLNLLESSRSAAMISASILAAAAILGAAQAATDTIFRYSTPRTGYFGIHSMALSPQGDGSLDYRSPWETEGLTVRPMNDGCFSAGVHLPHGATITQLRVFYKSDPLDDVGGPDGTVPTAYLLRREFSTNASQRVGFDALPDSATPTSYVVSLNDARTTVNNTRYSYGFGICLENSGDTFHSARITYRYDNAGD
jgi:hypothetical protein